MTEPKFHLGQHVAVCSVPVDGCRCGLDVLPSVTVSEVVYMPFAYCKCAIRYSGGWYYAVSPDTQDGLFGEHELRPIDPDKEYSDEEELTQEKAV